MIKWKCYNEDKILEGKFEFEPDVNWRITLHITSNRPGCRLEDHPPHHVKQTWMQTVYESRKPRGHSVFIGVEWRWHVHARFQHSLPWVSRFVQMIFKYYILPKIIDICTFFFILNCIFNYPYYNSLIFSIRWKLINSEPDEFM